MKEKSLEICWGGGSELGVKEREQIRNLSLQTHISKHLG
jgi:hypothetical protein